MSERPKRPALFAGHEFAAFAGGDDPAQVSAVAHEVARSLLSRVKADSSGIALEAAMSYVSEHGLDDLAQLWSASSAHSLPGALWRMYVIRDLIHRQSTQMSDMFARGVAALQTADPVIAGAPTPAGPEEIDALADAILRGAFTGDFADALTRAAAFCRVIAAGCLALADEADNAHPLPKVASPTSGHRAHAEQARALTQQASRLAHTASDLATCAKLWRRGSLD